MVHCLCFPSRTQSLKQVLIRHFSSSAFFIAVGLHLPLYIEFSLGYLFVVVSVCFIFSEHFSMLRSVCLMTEWEATAGSFCPAFALCYHLQCLEVFPQTLTFVLYIIYAVIHFVSLPLRFNFEFE